MTKPTTNTVLLAEFAKRLNDALDQINFSPKHQGRQIDLSKRMGVSQKGARKWLEGEAYPTLDKQLELAKLARVIFQWLMTGEGPHPHEGLTPKQRSMVQLMEAMTQEQQDELIKSAEETERRNREVIGELSRKLMGGQQR